MSFTSGIAKAGTWALDKLGLDWATGGAFSVFGVDSTPISIFLNVPDYHQDLSPVPDRSHGATLVLNVPNHSKEFGAIAKNMAQATLGQIELIVALQTIIDEKGGLTIKDQLDPYHYEVITEALKESIIEGAILIRPKWFASTPAACRSLRADSAEESYH